MLITHQETKLLLELGELKMEWKFAILSSWQIMRHKCLV